MKRIGIDLTENEHKEIKMFCIQNGTTIRQFCLNTIKEKINEKKAVRFNPQAKTRD